VIPYGPAYKRCLIDLPETFDAYLAKLSGTTRKDLRRTRQKFQTAFAGVFEVRTFSTLQEVPAYVKDAGEVVQQTYQWKLYGSGLTKTSQLEYAAEQGLLRCYVLYIEGRPAAFQTGYLYRDTYYAYATGYLSQYSKHQIGIFLLTEIFSELLTAGRPVKRLDFMQGENVSKTRLSTDIREERDYYLIPKTLRGALLACFLKTSLVFADVVKHISERTGIRAHIKKLLKRGLRG
jgi:hypothetical protein